MAKKTQFSGSFVGCRPGKNRNPYSTEPACSVKPGKVELRTSKLQIRLRAGCDAAANGLSLPEELSAVPETTPQDPSKLPENVTLRLRALAHDLSNSIETILQASYLLGQAKLDPHSKKWAHLIDTATQDAARINREIREILRSQS
jgi:signal transduction histidine kinase